MSKYNKNELEILINNGLTYESIGNLYGVTASAIRNAAHRLGIQLPTRRKVNEDENFSHNNKTKIDNWTDEEFKHIIQSNQNWKDIGTALGYAGSPSQEVRVKIRERCSKLGMEVLLQKPSSIIKKTKGELLSERKNYQSYRSSIRKFAENVYKNSGKQCQCAICGYDKHIEIAHIKAVSDFSDSSTIEEINSIDNLIALCPNHHWEYDNGILML